MDTTESRTSAASIPRAWGDWMREYRWTYAAHLNTGGFGWPAPKLLRVFEDVLIRYITKVTREPVAFAYAIEGGAMGDRPHLHALIHCPKMLNADRLLGAWFHAVESNCKMPTDQKRKKRWERRLPKRERQRVYCYDPARGAAFYLAKEIGGKVLDYGVSKRLPPLAGGCYVGEWVKQKVSLNPGRAA